VNCTARKISKILHLSALCRCVKITFSGWAPLTAFPSWIWRGGKKEEGQWTRAKGKIRQEEGGDKRRKDGYGYGVG